MFLNSHRNQLLTICDQAIVSGTNFTMGLLLARELGVSEYGLFALAWMIVLGVSSIHQALIIAPLYSLYPKQENKSGFLKNIVLTHLLFSVLCALFVFVFIEAIVWRNPVWNRPNASIILASCSFLFINYDFLRREAFMQKKAIGVLIADFITYGLQSCVVIALLPYGLNLTTIFIIIITLFFIGILLLTLSRLNYFIKLLTVNHGKQTWIKDLKLILSYSRSLIGTSVLQWFSGNFFIIAAGSILGTGVIGAIRIAQNIVGVLHIIFLAMENIIPAKAAELLYQEGKRKMYRYIRNIGLKAGVVVIGTLTLIGLFRYPLIETLYGQEYLQYHYLLISYCAIYLLVFIGTIYRFIIRTVEMNDTILISYIITTIFSVLVAKPIIIHFGAIGVIIGLLSTQVIAIAIFTYALKSELTWIRK